LPQRIKDRETDNLTKAAARKKKHKKYQNWKKRNPGRINNNLKLKTKAITLTGFQPQLDH
jgi:hypothetical protein